MMVRTLAAAALLVFAPAMLHPAHGTSPVRTPLEQGRLIYHTHGCMACHSVDGTKGIGSTAKGLFGQLLEMEDGQVIRVDEDFIRESVRHPSRHITKGYANLMPRMRMRDEELDVLVAYIRSLGNADAVAKLRLLEETRPEGVDPKASDLVSVDNVMRGRDAAEYVWRVEPSKPIRVSHGLARWRGERLLAHVGAGTSGKGDAQPRDLFLRLTREEGVLKATLGRRWVKGAGPRSGEATMTTKLDPVQGASLEIRWLPGEERSLHHDRYLCLWEGRWMRAGEVVERVTFLARAIGPDEVFEGFMAGEEEPMTMVEIDEARRETEASSDDVP